MFQTAIATCEDGVRSKQSQVIVESTTLAARLSNRLLMALARESDNSEDIGLKKQINQSENKLKMVIAPFVESSKTMAINISDQRHHQRWRASSDALVSMVQEVAKLFTDLQLHSPALANTRVPVIVEPPPQVPPPPSQVTPHLYYIVGFGCFSLRVGSPQKIFVTFSNKNKRLASPERSKHCHTYASYSAAPI